MPSKNYRRLINGTHLQTSKNRHSCSLISTIKYNHLRTTNYSIYITNYTIVELHLNYSSKKSHFVYKCLQITTTNYYTKKINYSRDNTQMFTNAINRLNNHFV